DRDRLHALASGKKPSYNPLLIGKIGFAGYVLSVFGGLLQRKIGASVGAMPGQEMLHALKAARTKGISVSLIDQPIQVTLQRFSKSFTFRQRMRFIWDLFTAPFGPKVKIDLDRVPDEDVISLALTQMKERYPALYV